MKRLCMVVAAAGSWGWVGTSQGLDIVLDYTHDTFFASNPNAKFALEGAAADLSLLITTSLNPTVDINIGEAGTPPFISTATFNHSLSYTNPATASSSVTVSDASLVADEFRVFVGMRPISGSTLGVGGPGGAGYSGTTSFYNTTDRDSAIADAAAQSSANFSRGGGPTILTLSGTFSGVPVSIAHGPTLGKVSFDNDTDNNGSADSTGQLEASWHFDLTTPVAAGKDDFYSVALHEILHALGYGASQSWDEQVSGTNWLGPQVNSIVSGTNLVDPGLGHLATNTMSTSWVDGAAQEVVMDPNILEGTRKHLTLLDLAVLQDIGWDVHLPEPGDTNNDGEVDQADLDILLSHFGASVPSVAFGDWDRDFRVDYDDLNITLRNWTGSAAPVYSIPEPGSAALLALGGLVLARRRPRRVADNPAE